MAKKKVKESPAKRILRLLDMSALALSKKLDLSEAAVYRWTYSREKAGTGGLIPQKYHEAIVEIAKKKKIVIKPTDFLTV